MKIIMFDSFRQFKSGFSYNHYDGIESNGLFKMDLSDANSLCSNMKTFGRIFASYATYPFVRDIQNKLMVKI